MSSQSTSTPIVDCLILGGGPAGLSTALGLARQTRTCVLFDSGSYRNTKISHMHNVSTWDHRNPAEFRAAARKELMDRYDTVQFADVTVTKVWKADNIGERNTGFEVTDGDGKVWRGSKVVLATGVTDEMPELEGYAECWPRSIYHCLFCYGFEERVAPSVGVLAIGATAVAGMAEHLARLAHNLAQTVTIYTSGNEALTKDLEGKVGRDARCTIDSRPILRLTPTSGIDVLVELEDGASVEQGFLVNMCKNSPNFSFEHNLNLELSATGSEFKTSLPFNEITEQGVFATGDAASMMKSVMLAQGSGSVTAVGVATSLIYDEAL